MGEREYYAYQAELRKIRQEKQAAERDEWKKQKDLENKQKMADRLEEQPYVAEITLIEQTIAFCNSLVQKKGEDATKEKKGKSKNKAGKSDGGSKPIKHNAETFRLFDQ